jgi:hypothetical protein
VPDATTSGLRHALATGAAFAAAAALIALATTNTHQDPTEPHGDEIEPDQSHDAAGLEPAIKEIS